MRIILKISVMITLWLMAPDNAVAQDVLGSADVISIREQADSDYDPLGIPVRSFLVHPAIQLREQYNDNIFADSSNEQSDFITNIRPALSVRSNWDIHALRFFAGGDIGVYADNTNENFEDFRIGANGRYDVGYDTFFDGEIRYSRTHEDRSSPDDASSDEPTLIGITSAQVGFTRALAKLKLFLNARVRDIEYDNGVAGGAVIDNSFRNRTESEFDARVAYELSPNYEMFLRGVYDHRDYETSAFPDRTSDGFRIEAGTAIHISGKVKGEIHGGYIAQDYGDGFRDVSTGDFGASLLWKPSGLTSLRLGLDRDVIETTGASASGYIRTNATFTAEHAFENNLVGIFEFIYVDDNFVGIDRDDETFGGALELEYKPMRGWETSLRYDYRQRESSFAAEDFDNHRVTLRAGYTF